MPDCSTCSEMRSESRDAYYAIIAKLHCVIDDFGVATKILFICRDCIPLWDERGLTKTWGEWVPLNLNAPAKFQ